MLLPDLLILTAANFAQARGYQRALRSRRERGLIPDSTRTLVVPDCGGRRIGSGASTFLALREAARSLLEDRRGARPAPRSLGEIFTGWSIWIIHSGGDARRLPAYAPIGKIFVPLPFVAADGGVGSLFELVVDDLAKLPVSPGGQVVVAAGDLLVGLDGIGSLPDAPVVGVGAVRGMDVAQRHGVYVADRRGGVVDFLQKPSRAEAVARGALTGTGKALVDAGVVILRPTAAARWLAAAGVTLVRPAVTRLATSGLLAAVERGDAPSLDLYVHVLSSFAPRIDDGAYLAACAAATGAIAPRDAQRLLALRARLRVDHQRIVVAPRPLFFHAGTTRELIDHCTGPSRAARRLSFARSVVSSHDQLEQLERLERLGRVGRLNWRDRLGRVTTIGSAVSTRAGAVTLGRLAASFVVEGCELLAPIRLDGANLVAGLRDDLLGRHDPIRLRHGRCFACFPVGRRHWTIVVHGDTDDFKTPIADGGTWCGAPLSRRIALNPTAWRGVVRDERGSLFDVPLWPVVQATRVLEMTRWMLDEWPTPPAPWRRARRVSLRELLAAVDHDRLDAARRSISSCEAHRAASALASDAWRSAAAIVGDATRPQIVEAAALERERRVTRQDPFAAARAATVAAVAATKSGRPARATVHHQRALELVGHGVAERAEVRGRTVCSALDRHEMVRCDAPVRIDLAGGWSDTPPICNEVGGVVVNVAVSLRGVRPIGVTARLLDHPVVELRSRDAGEVRVLSSTSDLIDHCTPGDWTALAKAALVLTGIVPAAAGESLARRLARFGGGVGLTMWSNVPQGSGLGTSSILGAAILAALGRLCGERFDRRRLVLRTSALEQMISTRGGWQDQVGGIVGGFKIAHSEPGAVQHPRVRRIDVPRAMLEELRTRSVLLFTGKRRLAKHVLETVVGRWLARDPGVREIVTELREGAEAMAMALQRGRFDDFAWRFGGYWRLKCALDPASTTPAIEAIFAAHRRDLVAWGLTGAGGGGFALLIARDAAAARRVRQSLTSSPPTRGAEVFDFEIDGSGLGVTVESRA